MVPVDRRVIYVLFGTIRLLLTSMDFSEVCPLTSFCADRRQSNHTYHQSKSCCLPCSCHKNCKLVGTCCYDAETDDRLQQLYSCKTQMEIYDKYLSLTFSSIDSFSVSVVTDCHDDGVDVSNETIFHCKIAKELEDLTFVTGKDSGITYLNKHCALCNGEDNFDAWHLYIVSHSFNQNEVFSNMDTYKTRDEYLIRTGSIMSLPPTEFAGLSAYCPIKTPVYICNETGQWQIYEKAIDEKCNRYYALYSHPGETHFFKNPFCFICNKPINTTLKKRCNIKWDTLYSRFVGLTLTALISSQKENDDRMNSRPVCKFGETINIFKGTCTKLLCPPSTVVKDDYCDPLFEDDSNIGMSVYFQVIFEDPAVHNPIEQKDFLKELLDVIVLKIKQDEPECDFCAAVFYAIDDELTFYIAFTSYKGCRYLQYTKRIAMIYKTPIRTFSRSLQENITLYGIDGPGNIQKASEQKVIRNPAFTGVPCGGSRFSEKLIPCPSILISVADIDGLEVKDEILSIGVDLGNGTLRVCLQEYNKIYAQSSNAVRVFNSDLSSIFVMIYILYFYKKTYN